MWMTQYSPGSASIVYPCRLSSRLSMLKYNITQDGDIIIGGIFSVHYQLFQSTRGHPVTMCMFISPQYYRHVLAFIFAIDEINHDPNILPNITLGYHVYDSCHDVNRALEGVIHILSGMKITVPNYSCGQHDKLAGFIGDLAADTSLFISHILGVYGFSQISYGSTNSFLSEKRHYPSFFRMVQDDSIQFVAIASLMKHFGWTWVGIITSPDDSGVTEGQELRKEMAAHKICTEFLVSIQQRGSINDQTIYSEVSDVLHNASSQVVVICGQVPMQFFLFMQDKHDLLSNKTLIFSSSWTFSPDFEGCLVDALNGSILFTIPKRHIPGLQSFLQNVHPSIRPDDTLLEDIWAQFFQCYTANPEKNEIFQAIYDLNLQNCTGKEKIVDISSVVYDTHSFRTSYNVYVSGYIMAHALHNIFYSHSETTLKCNSKSYKHEFKNYIRNIHFIDPVGEEIYFNNKGAIPTQYQILNRVLLANGTFLEKIVGHFSMSKPDEHHLLINTKDIIWKKDTDGVPQSLCTESCNPGSRRVLPKGNQPCCYECIECAEGEISTEKAVILAIFIVFRDTPIVRANNSKLSFVLLISLSLTFLCIFFFIGRPINVTCMLRQTSFGVIFTVAVSTVLAKTIMVCIAFKATKPGNMWNKWVGAKLSYTVVISCSLIQVLICLVWLALFPPFQDVNTHSFPKKIIVTCNEGSPLAFYCVLGYIGILAAVSFIVAFLVRTLPDTFNEAKYITFSMLVFCCVWICAIPVYLSTIGKNTVSTEIFAIMASSAGLLACIFFPKCYIILIRPDRNTKQLLLGKK
ncbi:vomeronasal type-2 receptor 26-like [Pelodytes ibericus]